MTGSNCRPPGCKPGALPAELTALPESEIKHCRSLPSRNKQAEPASARAPPRKSSTASRLAVAGLFQGFASAEFRHARGWDLYLGAGARIAAGRGLALRDLKIPETHDPDGVAALQSFSIFLNVASTAFSAASFDRSEFLRHLGDKFSFVHGCSSFRSALIQCGVNPPRAALGLRSDSQTSGV